MPSVYFEDFVPGQSAVYGPFHLSKDMLVDFSRRYDPLPFHLDEEAAKGTFAGRLTASGWQSCSILMRIIADGFMNDSSSCGSPGIDEVKWLKPVLPDDTLSVRADVWDIKASRSKPDIGLVKFHFALLNQLKETVATETAWVIFGRRGTTVSPMKPPVGLPLAAARRAPSGDEVTPLPYLEEIVVGQETVLGTHTFMADDIVSFAQRYDPQPFHTDSNRASTSFFGGLCASGWHTAVEWMRLQVDTWTAQSAQTAKQGKPVPQLGPSPGFKNLKWLKPVYAGDTITYASTVTGWRPSASKPGWGLVFNRNVGRNQYGETVFEFDGVIFWQSRKAVDL